MFIAFLVVSALALLFLAQTRFEHKPDDAAIFQLLAAMFGIVAFVILIAAAFR